MTPWFRKRLRCVKCVWRVDASAAGEAATDEAGSPLAMCGSTQRTRLWGVFGQSVPSITVSDVESRRSDGWMILDVREDDEWAAGRIPGSTHIPMHEVVARLDEVEDRVVCVCAVGGRSARVTAYLTSQGRDAVNLDGGIYAWAGEGRPVES